MNEPFSSAEETANAPAGPAPHALLTGESQICELATSAVQTEAPHAAGPAPEAPGTAESATPAPATDQLLGGATSGADGAPAETGVSSAPAVPAPSAMPEARWDDAPLADALPIATGLPQSMPEAGSASASTAEAAPLATAPGTGATPDATGMPAAPASLPDAREPQPEALRALFPGAFLRGEFEVREILARGTTNLYKAVGGDYGSPEPKLIAERASQASPEPVSSLIPHPSSLDAQHSALRPAHESFAQDDREYLVFDWFESTALQDWRGATNDEQLLAMLAPVAGFLQETHAAGQTAAVSTETLRVDETGAVRYIGFTAPGAGDPLEDLRSVADFAFKHVFAQSATMRLDDRFAGLALSDELKDFARTLDDEVSGFASIDEAAAMLAALGATSLRTNYALLSDVGQEREVNEDAGMIVASQRAGHLQNYARELFVVSDGMGGHEGGEVASDLTLSSLQKHTDALDLDWNDNAAIRAALVDVIDAVNADVVALTESDQYRGTRAKPGATLTFALRLGARLFIGNVGDSRAYLFRDGQLLRVTKDHSYVQNLIDRGELDEEGAWGHPEGSVITAHIGYPKLKTRDVYVRLARPGDRWLLVSDGVIDMLRDREIAPHLQGETPAAVVRNLVDASNAAGGADNITALCVDFGT